jgi:hypothetical protein
MMAQRSLTGEERQKVMSVARDFLSDDLHLPAEATEYDVLMKQKAEEFIEFLLKDDEPGEITLLMEICDDHNDKANEERSAGADFQLAMLYDMWLNKSIFWPVRNNPEWAEWEKLKKIKAGKMESQFVKGSEEFASKLCRPD